MRYKGSRCLRMWTCVLLLTVLLANGCVKTLPEEAKPTNVIQQTEGISPTAEITQAEEEKPTAEITQAEEEKPTVEITQAAVGTPSLMVTLTPTAAVTLTAEEPTGILTAVPTKVSEDKPTATVKPTAVPTKKPTVTAVPTKKPTVTAVPTKKPTATAVPTKKPTVTAVPTKKPTATAVPTKKPTVTAVPTKKPTATAVPTKKPTVTQAKKPTATAVPTKKPTAVPTKKPIAVITPTPMPTITPFFTVIKEALEVVNERRAEEGLRPFTWSDKLAEIACQRSKDSLEEWVATNGQSVHTGGPAGISEVAGGGAACRWEWIIRGQIEVLVDAWIASPGHRYVIMTTTTEDFEVIYDLNVNGVIYKPGEIWPGTPMSMGCACYSSDYGGWYILVIANTDQVDAIYNGTYQ